MSSILEHYRYTYSQRLGVHWLAGRGNINIIEIKIADQKNRETQPGGGSAIRFSAKISLKKNSKRIQFFIWLIFSPQNQLLW